MEEVEALLVGTSDALITLLHRLIHACLSPPSNLGRKLPGFYPDSGTTSITASTQEPEAPLAQPRNGAQRRIAGLWGRVKFLLTFSRNLLFYSSQRCERVAREAEGSATRQRRNARGAYGGTGEMTPLHH